MPQGPFPILEKYKLGIPCATRWSPALYIGRVPCRKPRKSMLPSSVGTLGEFGRGFPQLPLGI